jgi:hypothetical protein
MATKSIAWNTGTGNITLTCQGQGDGAIFVQSDANNLGSARSQVITVETTKGSPKQTKTFVISQTASPFVDLGLPSGLLWAKGNLCKDSQGNYYIGEETDYGTYVSWGNIDGHNEGEGYNFDQTTYDSTTGKSVSGNILSNDAAHDIAFAKLGAPYHLPTKEDFQELDDNTDSEWTTINGVAGQKFMKKLDHSIYVFFPANGNMDGTALGFKNSRGYYWSASFYSRASCFELFFSATTIEPQRGRSRYLGFGVRAICNP